MCNKMKLKTLFVEIDEVLNANDGEGKLIALASRPGMGKTTLMLDIMLNIAVMNDDNILFFTFNLSKDEILNRFKAKKELSDADLSKICIIDKDFSGVNEIETTISNNNFSVVFIDSVESINDYNNGKNEEILLHLKSVCRKNHISIMYTCQLPRPAEQRKDKRPALIDIDEVTAKTVDAMFALYRPTYYECPDPVAELKFLKNSLGELYEIPLRYDTNTHSYYYDLNCEFDPAPEKRVELHLHTKMSDDISIIGVKEALDFFDYNNYKAVAFTNLNNVQDFIKIANHNKKQNIKPIYGAEVRYETKCGSPMTMTLLVKNQEGFKELYTIISSLSDTEVGKQVDYGIIKGNHNNLLCGSSGDNSELFFAFLELKTDSEIERIALQYDYFEIFPTKDIGTREIYKKIARLGDKLEIPVVASGNCHYFWPEEDLYRDIILCAKGNLVNMLDIFHIQNTNDMLEEFSYLGKEKAYEIVVKNTNMIADMIEEISPIIENSFDLMLPDADNKIFTIAMKKAESLYGDILPEEVLERILVEFSLICNGEYAAQYLIAHYLTEYAKQKGYPVSLTGAIGSSLFAFLLGITEINPLKPYYLCNECKHIEFAEQKVYTGYDLLHKKCPVCGSDMKGDGHNIPFEFFMGLNGEKVPDISLCFPMSVRTDIINHLCSIVGKENLAFAKSVYGITEPRAERYIAMYQEITKTKFSDSEKTDIICQMQGIKCVEKIHPAGIFVLPENNDFLSYTPLETYSVNDCLVDKITHLDFNDLHDVITKLNILGYNPLEQLRLLENYTGVSRKEIDINSTEIFSLFKDSHILGIDSEEPATLGLPDFGNRIIRDILKKINPQSFGDLIKIIGLSHGTNIWLHNAETLIEKGNVTIKDVAATREDVFEDLLSLGVEKDLAFKITEEVRKGILGYTISDDDEFKNIGLPENHKAPQWYIDFLVKIKYLFPKAHAIEYVRLALMLGWYKIHYPTEFYAAYFEVYMKEEKYDFLPLGYNGVDMYLERIRKTLGVGRKLVEEMEKMNIFKECFARGIKFIYRKENNSATYIPSKENIIIINRNNI